MEILKKIFNFYINANIHVAVAVFSLFQITGHYFPMSSFRFKLGYFVFFATIAAYSFVKYAGFQQWHFKKFTNQLSYIRIFSWICFLVMLYFARQLSYRTLSFIAIPAALTLFYAVPFLSGFQRNLRSIGHLKILIVALVWTLVTVILPIYDSKIPLDVNEIAITIRRFLLIIVWILPFEIRDLQYDKISLQTIPQKIGVPNTKKLGLALLMICLVIEFMFTTSIMHRNIFLIIFFVTLVFLMRAKTNQSKYYSSFWVESIPIFWWILLLGYDNFTRFFP